MLKLGWPPNRLELAAMIFIIVGVVETLLLAYAPVTDWAFSSAGIVYIFAGYRLIRRTAGTYAFVTVLLSMALAGVVALLLYVAVLGGQLLWTRSFAIGFEGDWRILWGVFSFALSVPLVALLFHPDTRARFGLPPAGESIRTLYLDCVRFSMVLAGGLVLSAVALGPHLFTNSFRSILDAFHDSPDVARRIGAVESLTLVGLREFNWRLTAQIRAVGSKGVVHYDAETGPFTPTTLDAYDVEGARYSLDDFPPPEAAPAVAETTADPATSGESVVLLSTSFEPRPDAADNILNPFSQIGKVPWARDRRAHSGQASINLIPEGNPGKLGYFHEFVNGALLSSRLDNRYEPFPVEGFARIELDFWRLTTSNPSTTHNCLGSLDIAYKLDGGEWQQRMNYCGAHKSKPHEWRHAVLKIDTAGHKVLELRFEYEYPPDTRLDKTVVYLIDDLAVRGYR